MKTSALESEAVEAYEKSRSAQIREEKLRTCIFSASEEIRDLEKKLSNAHMNHERALQIQQRKLISDHEKQREAHLNAQMNKKLDLLKDQELTKEKMAYERSKQYQKALQSQLEETEDKKAKEYDQFLKEKQMVDDIVRNILEEDAM